jgi:hypothetical protein
MIRAMTEITRYTLEGAHKFVNPWIAIYHTGIFYCWFRGEGEGEGFIPVKI